MTAQPTPIVPPDFAGARPWQDQLAETIIAVRRSLADPDAKEFTLTLSRRQAILWLDYLQTMDPDMPRRPIMKALGPLVGDFMMNDKLNRLNSLIDKIGPAAVALTMLIDRMERRDGK